MAGLSGQEWHDLLAALRDIENELREQASGSQDGYLLDIANRLRAAVKKIPA